MLTGFQQLNIVQGIDYPFSFTIDEEVASLLERAVLSCKELGWCIELDKSLDGLVYSCVIKGSTTRDVPPQYTTYDVTFYYNSRINISNDCQTGITLQIMERYNPPSCIIEE